MLSCSRLYRAKPFDLLGEDDVQHDNIFFIIREFVRSIIANRIPKDERWPYKDGWGKTDTERLGWDRIEKLFNPLYGVLRTRYPTLKHFHGNSSDQSWWKDMKNDLKKGYNREKNQAKDDSFDPKCRALYIVNRREQIRYHPDTIEMDLRLDLFNVVRRMKQKSVGSDRREYNII